MKKYKNIILLSIIVFILYITYGFKFSLYFIISYLLHETFHILIINKYNIKIKSINLIPFGGQILLDTCFDKSNKEDLVIYFSGPFINLILITISLIFNNHILLIINLILFLFNLIPIIPLDGFYILLNILSFKLPFYYAYKVSIIISLILSIILFIFSFIINISILILSIYMIILSILSLKNNYIYNHILFEKISKENNSLNYKQIKPSLKIKNIIYKGYNTYFIMSNKVYTDKYIIKLNK